MDIVNSLASTVKLELLSQKAGDIIARLQKAGLFRAIVIEQQGKQVLLDTAFGQLKGKAPANLNKGDEILARLTANKPEPALNIIQHKVRAIALNAAAIKLVSPYVARQPVLAIVNQRGETTQLKIGEHRLSLPKQSVLQDGETILLKRTESQAIQVTRVKPEAMLKNALSQLLPRQLPVQSGNNLANLQNLATELTSSRLPQLESRFFSQQNKSSAGQKSAVKEVVTPRTQAVEQASSSNKPVSEKSITESQVVIRQLLTSVAKPLARIENLNPQTVQKIMTLLSLVKPGIQATPNLPLKNLPESLKGLMQEMKNSPEAFKLLVTKIFSSHSNTGQQVNQERFIQDISQFLRSELVQQSEQSLNQLLTQKTALKLQVETQQPLQVHLNIPVEVDNESRNVELKVKEKQRNEQESEQHWEIDLTFEFGLLGQISTHILLQENKLSAHFWAIKATTKTLIETHLDQFKQQLHKSGFELGLFNCYQGSPPEPRQTAPVLLTDNLLDIKV